MLRSAYLTQSCASGLLRWHRRVQICSLRVIICASEVLRCTSRPLRSASELQRSIKLTRRNVGVKLPSIRLSHHTITLKICTIKRMVCWVNSAQQTITTILGYTVLLLGVTIAGFSSLKKLLQFLQLVFVAFAASTRHKISVGII